MSQQTAPAPIYIKPDHPPKPGNHPLPVPPLFPQCRDVPIQVRPTFIQRADVSGYVQVVIKRRWLIGLHSLNGRKWLRCRDVPIRCVRRLFNVQVFPNTYRSLFSDGY